TARCRGGGVHAHVRGLVAAYGPHRQSPLTTLSKCSFDCTVISLSYNAATLPFMPSFSRIPCSIFALIAFPALHAQGLLGTILGTVTDTSGAVIGGASIKARSAATNLEVSTVTRENGLYQIPNLPIGTYSVSISKTGFQTEVHSQIVVQADRSTTVNSMLQIGAVSQTVEVSATPLLNEVDTTHGYVLDEGVIRNTPLGTGSFTQLA